MIIEGDPERPEERAELAESRCREVDERIPVTDQNPRCVCAAEEQHSEREDSDGEEAKILMVKLKAAETGAEFAETSAAKREKTIEDLEDKLKCTKDEHLRTQRTLHQALLGLNETTSTLGPPCCCSSL